MSRMLYAALLYLLMAIAVTFPLILSMGTAVSDPVDAILNTWIVAHVHHTLLTTPGELLNTNIFYPYSWTLLFSETLLLPSLILLPVHALTGNALLVHNVLVLLGFTFTATSGYLLGRWLFHRFWPAFTVGAIFAFNSFMLSNVGQAQLLHFEWMPLALLYVGKTLRKPTRRGGLFIACLLAAQFYTVIYYGIFSFMVVGLVGGMAWLFRAYPTRAARLRSGATVALGYIGAVALCAPLAWLYMTTSDFFAFTRTLNETWPYSASLESWTTALTNNLFYGAWRGDELPVLGYYALDALFVGVALLSLALVGAARGVWRVHRLMRVSDHPARGQFYLWPIFTLGGIGLFLLLSFGPYPQVASLQPNFAITLPYAWVHEWLPGFQALRAPVRFAAIVYLGLAVFAAYSLRFVRPRLLQIGLVALLVGEVLVRPASALHAPQTTADQAAAHAWLASIPPTAYIEFPIYPFGEAGTEEHWLESQYHSIRHWQATPVGYSGFFPPRHAELLASLSSFPRTESVELLQAMAVEWVVIQRERMTDVEKTSIDRAIRTHGWQVKRWGEVWAIHLPARPASPPAVRYHLPNVAQAGGTATFGMQLLSEDPTPVPPNRGMVQLRVEWYQGDALVLAADQVVQPPFYIDDVAVANFSVPVPEQAATYRVHVVAGTSPQAVATQVVEVVNDSAPPEATLLPVQAIDATLVCTPDAADGEEVATATVKMQTIGWYDEPFTLSGRIVDGDGVELARSARDVEFPPDASRRMLLRVQPYTLPFDALPVDALPLATDQPIFVALAAYQWQQAAERVVPRHFVDDQGEVIPILTLPVTVTASCEP